MHEWLEFDKSFSTTDHTYISSLSKLAVVVLPLLYQKCFPKYELQWIKREIFSCLMGRKFKINCAGKLHKLICKSFMSLDFNYSWQFIENYFAILLFTYCYYLNVFSKTGVYKRYSVRILYRPYCLNIFINVMQRADSDCTFRFLH